MNSNILKAYEVECRINSYDSVEIVKLKKEMKKAFIQQEKLVEKYKGVSQYANLGYKINNIKEQIEILYETED